MKRYQKLIQDAVGGDSGSHSPGKKSGYNILSREMGAPSTSIHEWATYPHKVPAYKSLVRLAEYFAVSLPTLLMEHDDPLVPVFDKLFTAEPQTVAIVKSLLTSGNDSTTLELVKLFLLMDAEEKDTLREALKRLKVVR